MYPLGIRSLFKRHRLQKEWIETIQARREARRIELHLSVDEADEVLTEIG